MSRQISKSYLRSISKYLDGKNYFETFVENNATKVKALKSQLKKEIEIPDSTSKEELLNVLYEFISSEYPNDIIYKINFLECINEFISSPLDSYIVNEFKFSRNITDLAVFNGKSICFEIKSDLDKADNVVTQFKQYERVFDFCYLITREDRVSEFIAKLPNSAGIIVLDKNNNFHLERLSKRSDKILFEKLFRILRKDEYLEIVSKFYDGIPNVPNTQIFSKSFNLLREIEFEKFKKEFLKKIKSRSYSVCIPKLKQVNKIKRQGFLANSELLNK